MDDGQRLTLPTLFVSGATDDTDSQKEQWNSKWYSRLFDVACGSMRKLGANKDKMQVNVAPTSITIPYLRKGPRDLESNLLTTDIPDVVKLLLVFSKDDQQMSVLVAAARRLGWSVSTAKNSEQAVESFQSRIHHMVIIDHRGNRGADADGICRAIKSTTVYHSAVIIALVKKTYFMISDTENMVGLELLSNGYTCALMECANEGILINELIGLYTAGILPRMRLSAAHALYLALDRCRDMVHVANEKNIILFVNKVSEKILGYKPEEMMNRSLHDFVFFDNATLMEQHITKGREFEGNMNCKRKNEQKLLTINCRIIPYCVSGRKPTHFIYVYDTMYLSENGPLSPINAPHRISILSTMRKPSDAMSAPFSGEGPRRSSAHRLSSLQLEAPITKVITLLSNALVDAGNTEVAGQITKAINILKTTELYSPYVRESTNNRGISPADPITMDLVGALLTTPRSKDARRLSSESVRMSTMKMITTVGNARMPPLKSFRVPHEIAEILDNGLAWDYDIFKLEVLTERRPLVFLGMTLLNMYHATVRLSCDERTLQNWLTIIEMHYRSGNSYHNSTHAADVLQATARFMQSERMKQILEPLDEIAALIAAAAHDIDHPGRSSQFLCNSGNKLAILYNDVSVLESHHAALTFKLSLSDDSVNIFKNLERDVYKMVRQNIIDMILATEMTKHFEHLAKFMNVCTARMGDGSMETYSDSLDMAVLLQPENVVLIKRMMIKCADVSNPMRPLKNCIEWTRRIAEEYFSQTDEEKEANMPVVMPLFDRVKCSIPHSQIGFVDYIINDMIEAWDNFIDMPELVGYMKQNYEAWKSFMEQGITTLQDIEKVQESPELRVPRLT